MKVRLVIACLMLLAIACTSRAGEPTLAPTKKPASDIPAKMPAALPVVESDAAAFIAALDDIEQRRVEALPEIPPNISRFVLDPARRYPEYRTAILGLYLELIALQAPSNAQHVKDALLAAYNLELSAQFLAGFDSGSVRARVGYRVSGFPDLGPNDLPAVLTEYSDTHTTERYLRESDWVFAQFLRRDASRLLDELRSTPQQ